MNIISYLSDIYLADQLIKLYITFQNDVSWRAIIYLNILQKKRLSSLEFIVESIKESQLNYILICKNSFLLVI